MFTNTARLTVEFEFESLGAHRLDPRAAIENGRGHGALAKIVAGNDGVLRRRSWRGRRYVDLALWSIVRENWQSKAVWGSRVH